MLKIGQRTDLTVGLRVCVRLHACTRGCELAGALARLYEYVLARGSEAGNADFDTGNVGCTSVILSNKLERITQWNSAKRMLGMHILWGERGGGQARKAKSWRFGVSARRPRESARARRVRAKARAAVGPSALTPADEGANARVAAPACSASAAAATHGRPQVLRPSALTSSQTVGARARAWRGE
eukprot:6184296-Pleurochrysis_carterae.AAC.4